VPIRKVEVVTDEQALELGFRGSPTIRLDGVDLVELAGGSDPSAGDPAALTCRLYLRRDGRISPTPDPAEIDAALERWTKPPDGARQPSPQQPSPQQPSPQQPSPEIA